MKRKPDGTVQVSLDREYVDPKRIYGFGNSEGNPHGYQLTTELKLAVLVLLAVPGRNVTDVMRGQLEAQMASLPDPSRIMEGFDGLMAGFLAGERFEADPFVPEGLNNLVQCLYAPINLPFSREFFRLDPAPLWDRSLLRCWL